eukprot:TRINITY_DN23317_c0_g1_i1.p1 TRINITY_DN23317_c0_g1~~TRINITY_DN23317_c0_g1_i1.p1  ORF type:complete len:367 (+),score=111.84 TRINITY_DN23317_c0_g1_i1:66-1103(+)
MAPKKQTGRETPQGDDKRPKTANDRALEETERELRLTEETIAKWEDRVKAVQDSARKNDERISVADTAIASCERMLRELEDQCRVVLRKRAEAEAQELAAQQDPKGGAKKGGGKAPTPDLPADQAQRQEELQLLTDLLLRYFRCDPQKEDDLNAPTPRMVCGVPLPPTGDSVPELARRVKADVLRDLEAAREAEDTAAAGKGGKAAPRGGSAGKAKGGGPTPDGGEETRPVTPDPLPPLAAPKGIDRAAWQEVLRLRGKRLGVMDAMQHLRKELVPLGARKKGLDSMGALTDYAIEAVRVNHERLSERRQQEAANQQIEMEKWKEEQKRQQEQQAAAGKVAAKKK